MPTNLQSRSQYLVLAEFSRKAIRALSGYRDGALTEFPTEDLKRIVEALQSVQQGDTYQFGQRPASALGSYEQLRTLQQVFRRPEELKEAIALTSSLLKENGKRDAAATEKVISLFMDLQAKALWNFEQPVLFCLSWKWRGRSAVKITERTREKDTEALHGRREGGHPEAASAGARADLKTV